MALRSAALAAAAAVSLALAGPASAANRYIDDSGSDAGANNCQNAAAPCKTINYALSVGSSTDTYLVGGGSYPEQVGPIGGSASLMESNFKPPATAGAAVIDGGAGVGITSMTTGVISGLTVRGDSHAIQVNGGSPTISHAIFDDPDQNTGGRVDVTSTASATIDSSAFHGVAGTTNDAAVFVQTTGHVTVARSTLEHFNRGVYSQQASSTTVRDSAITFHQGIAATEGDGIAIQAGTGTILRNRVTAEAGFFTEGVVLNGGDMAMHGNAISGSGLAGVGLNAPGHLVTMDSDVVTGNRPGIRVSNASTGLKLVNETVAGNPSPSQVSSASSVSIDSSIVGSGGVSATGGCTITFSRGPTTAGNSCQKFQTSADPRFVSANDFHLKLSSPLIDRGNPLPPAAGAQDADGRLRALDGNRDCIVRRDMGAYEFVAKPCVRPKCKLKPKSSNVPLTGKNRGRVRLKATCKQKVGATLIGTLKVKQGGKTKSVSLGPVSAVLKRNVSKTLKLKLPKSALKALANGAKESARFKLTAKNANGATGTAKAKMKHLVAVP